MSFVYPSFFWALLALSVPIVVHLFNFRRYKRILFTNVRFLHEVNEETKSRQKLKHLLVLVSRCLAVIFLVAAFAQPYLKGKSEAVNTGTTVAGFYLDNSFSMNAETEKGPAFEVAKNKIREALGAFKENDRFFMLTNNSQAGGARLLTREELQSRLDETDFSPNQLTTAQIVQKAKAMFEKSPNSSRELFIISDMQQSMLQWQNQKPDTSFSIFAVPLITESKDNLSVDSVWSSSPVVQPGEVFTLTVRISNHGETDASSVSVRLLVDNMQKAAGVVDVAAGATAELSLDVVLNAAGWHTGQISIQDNPVVFDDSWYIAFPVREHVKITAINGQGASTFPARLFATDPYYAYTPQQEGQVDYTGLKNYDLIILNEIEDISSGLAADLSLAMQNGSNVLFVPPAEIKGNWVEWLKSFGTGSIEKISGGPFKSTGIDTKNDLFKNVFAKIPGNIDLPLASAYYRFVLPGGGRAQAVLSFTGGDQLIARQPVGRGQLFTLAVPLKDEWSNLQRHAIFVPLILRMSFSNSQEFDLSETIGSGNAVKVSGNFKRSESGIRLKKDKFEIVPEFYARLDQNYISDNGQITEAGIYTLNDGAYKEPIAYNYGRNESMMAFADAAEMQTHFQGYRFISFRDSNRPLGENLKKGRLGTPLWKWCIALVLLFLLFEIILLRFWKTTIKAPQAN